LQGYVVMDGAVRPGAIVAVAATGTGLMATSDRNGFYEIQGIAPGTYLASAVMIESAGIMDLFEPLHARVTIYEGETTVHNFGEETGAGVAGYCEPPPTADTLAYAIVRLPSGSWDASRLDLHDFAGWFSGDATAASSIMGMAKIGADGYFRIANLPEGEFLLEVYQTNPVALLVSGAGKPVYQNGITISGVDDVVLEIPLDD